MTADNGDIQPVVDSRRSSVTSLRGPRSSNSARRHSTPVPPAPAGPRSPHRVGSALTRYSVQAADLDVQQDTGDYVPLLGESQEQHITDMAAVEIKPVATPESVAEDLPLVDSYRSPEAFIETDEPPWTGLPPGVIAEHIGDDPADNWDSFQNQNETLPAYDAATLPSPPPEKQFLPQPERPQLGPGVMALRWFDKLHEHKVYQPVLTDLPKPPLPKTPPPPLASTLVSIDPPPPSPVASIASVESPFPPPLTVDDVLQSLPGGLEHYHDWYFCPECWGWLRIVVGTDSVPPVVPLDEWKSVGSWSPDRRGEEELAAVQEKHRLQDLLSAGKYDNRMIHHFHAFEKLVEPVDDPRIERIQVEGLKEDFAHLDKEGYGETPDELVNFDLGRKRKTTLHVSCSSDVWAIVDGPVGGQIPLGLAKQFTDERYENPPAGQDGNQSFIEAWQLVLT